MRNGIIHFSPAFTEVMEDARLFVQQVRGLARQPVGQSRRLTLN